MNPQANTVIQLRTETLLANQRISLARPGKRNGGLIRLRGNDTLALSECDLYSALYEREFELVYQTCHDLISHQVTGIEAMIRWRHPEQGLILPGRFIGLAEKSSDRSLINGIWGFVLNESLTQLKAWRERGIVTQETTLALNVSPAQIANDDGYLMQSIGDALSALDLPASVLELDFARVQPVSACHKTANVFTELSRSGIKVALDDFGIGHFDLRQVIESHVDVIKIDRTLAHRMTQSDRQMNITRSLVDLFRSIGTRVVMEGVETALQADCVAQIGADCAQGYFFSHPVPGERYCSV